MERNRKKFDINAKKDNHCNIIKEINWFCEDTDTYAKCTSFLKNIIENNPNIELSNNPIGSCQHLNEMYHGHKHYNNNVLQEFCHEKTTKKDVVI